MMHGGYRIRVVVEQVLTDDSTGDQPGNEPTVVIEHETATYPLQGVDFSAALGNPVAAVLDIQAYDVAVKIGEDVGEVERLEREQRYSDLRTAAAVVRVDGAAALAGAGRSTEGEG